MQVCRSCSFTGEEGVVVCCVNKACDTEDVPKPGMADFSSLGSRPARLWNSAAGRQHGGFWEGWAGLSEEGATVLLKIQYKLNKCLSLVALQSSYHELADVLKAPHPTLQWLKRDVSCP